MTTSGRRERLRDAIATAAAQLAKSEAVATERAAAPGDLFVFGVKADLGLEWLLVRFHPDDTGLALIAPVDTFPLAGTPDVVLSVETADRRATVRCGETDWIPARYCSARLRVGTLPETALSAVRQRLADLVRGRPLPTPDPAVDFDAEYEDWMTEVALARHEVVTKAERLTSGPSEVISLSNFRSDRPTRFVPQVEYPLAAEPRGALFAELGSEMAGETDVTYHEVPGITGGRLVLVADGQGIRPVWEGPRDAAPTLRGHDESGEEQAVTWASGPEGVLHRASTVLPWVDGRVVLRIGGDPAKTLAVEL